jgi:DNA polymerase III subunit beta
MQILVRRNDLVKELQLVQGIVERKSSIPILSNVLVEARAGEIGISATDLDVSLRTSCAAQVTAEGAVTLGAKKLYEIVRSLPESDVSVTVEPDAWAKVKCERVEFRMPGLPREDFPSLPEGGEGRAIEIPAAVLRLLIQRTAFAVTAEDARYYLAGVLLVLDKEQVAMVATDGHRLSWAQRTTPLSLTEEVRVLVPRKAIAELAHMLEELGTDATVAFRRGDNHLIFSAGGRTLTAKMIEAQFPAYEKVVTVAGDKRVTVQRDRLQNAIRRVSLLSSERGRAVRLRLASDSLEISASSPDLGEAHELLPIEYSGAEADIGFNAQYILDFLGAVGTPEIALEMKDSESQGLLRPVGDEGGEYRYVVMQMRL